MAWPYSLSVVDAFDRADGALGAAWGSWPSSFYNTAFVIDANAARGQSGQHNGSRYLTSYGPDMGAYYTFAITPTGSFGGIFVRADGSTDTHGYMLTWLAATNEFRIDAPSGTIATTTQAVAGGDSIGIEAVGTTIKAHYKASGGSWVEKLSVTNSEITAAGYAGFFGNSNLPWYNDFAADTIATPQTPPYANVTITA